MPHLTDTMLTYIEENLSTRTALGYAKGEVTSGQYDHDSGKQVEHHRRIAAAVLIPDSSNIWAHCDPKDLAIVIKNRLAR
jgi:hypothetical protein